MPAQDRRFHPARLASRADLGGGLTRTVIAPPPEVAATYTSPGQYVEILADGEAGFFVLAGEPGAAAWEFVMRAGGGASDVLLGGGPVSTLEVSGAIGPGFPMEEARGRPLLLVLTGTGVAACRPLVRRRIEGGDASRTQLYVGVRVREEAPNPDDLRQWMDAGVAVLVCLSQGSGPLADVPVARGYVQDVLRARAPLDPLREPRIFAVGLDAVVEALRALALEWGIPPERVYTNY